jgi:F-type H+-transporting ATPase subunit gamma
MAKTQDIKRRIRSIRNTMQLTRAMKMVAASKLRKAQQRIIAARPYSHQTYRLLRSLSARANPEISPLLMRHGDRRIQLIVVTGDKGLCGSFNAAILRQAESFAHGLQGKEISIAAIGKRGREYFVRRDYNVPREWIDVLRVVEFPLAAEIARYIIDLYVGEDIDEIYLIYNEFKSAIQARPVVERLLPVEPIELEEGQVAEDYIYEPNPQHLLDALLPHYVE